MKIESRDYCSQFQSCGKCLSRHTRVKCGWCPHSKQCIRNDKYDLFQPLFKNRQCPLPSERYEFRARTLGCGVSTGVGGGAIVCGIALVIMAFVLYLLIRCCCKCLCCLCCCCCDGARKRRRRITHHTRIRILPSNSSPLSSTSTYSHYNSCIDVESPPPCQFDPSYSVRNERASSPMIAPRPQHQPQHQPPHGYSDFTTTSECQSPAAAAAAAAPAAGSSSIGYTYVPPPQQYQSPSSFFPRSLTKWQKLKRAEASNGAPPPYTMQ